MIYKCCLLLSKAPEHGDTEFLVLSPRSKAAYSSDHLTCGNVKHLTKDITIVLLPGNSGSSRYKHALDSYCNARTQSGKSEQGAFSE